MPLLDRFLTLDRFLEAPERAVDSCDEFVGDLAARDLDVRYLLEWQHLACCAQHFTVSIETHFQFAARQVQGNTADKNAPWDVRIPCTRAFTNALLGP